MFFINFLKKYLITSQIFVSLCASLLGSFVLLEQESYQNNIFLLLFLTFWNGYLFTVFRKRTNAVNYSVIVFIVLSIIHLLFYSFFTYLKWLLIILIGIIYNADLFKIKIREFSLIKTFYVGFVWSLTISFYALPTFNLAWFFIVFLFVSGITFPFEIRDMEKDSFRTLPKAIGIKNTKILSFIFISVSGIIAYYFLHLNFSIQWLMTTILALIFILFVNQKRPDLYFSFFIESLSAMPFIIYWMTNTF